MTAPPLVGCVVWSYFSAMITFMRSINWKDELCGKNVERSWLMITNIVDQCKKQYVPKMRKGKKKKPSWITEHIKHKRENTKVMTDRKGNHLS